MLCDDALATTANSSTRDDQPWVGDWLGFVSRSRYGNDRLFRTHVALGKHIAVCQWRGAGYTATALVIIRSKYRTIRTFLQTPETTYRMDL